MSNHLYILRLGLVAILHWLCRPAGLITLIALLSFTSIVLSSTLFYYDNQKSQLSFYALYYNDIANRWVAKNDLLNVKEPLSKAVLTNATGQQFSVPLEDSYKQQWFDYYLTLMSTTGTTTFVCSVDEATGQVLTVQSDPLMLEKSNANILSQLARAQGLDATTSALFWGLTVSQTLNALLAVILFYQEKKERKARKET